MAIVAPRIKQLSPLLANQIAAGEVVERPASVVKELLENSIDAGASFIEITLEQGGKRLVQVRDDGVGIAKEDLGLALAKHATSKLTTTHDLEAIQSLGFRGEALASISAVSRLLLLSRQAGSDAWQVRVEGTERDPKISACAHPFGTTVTVEDLFFNVPARRKFLRTDKTEWLHCQALVTRAALSRFDIGFKLIHQDKIIYHLPIANTEAAQRARLLRLCGKAFVEQATFVDMHAAGLRVWGWLGAPEQAQSQAELQHCFLNQRMVRDRVINHAIRQAYGERIFPGRYPCYVLYLTVSPEQVDVNVHPTKHEVRFHESRLIHDFLVSNLQQALQDGPQTVAVELVESTETTAATPRSPSASSSERTELFEPAETLQSVASRSNAFSAKSSTYRSDFNFNRDYRAESLAGLKLNLSGAPQQCASATASAPSMISATSATTPATTPLLALIKGRYLIREVSNDTAGVAIIDAYCLRFELARLGFEKAWQAQQQLPSKPLLLPQTLTFTEKELKQLSPQQPLLNALGFTADQISWDQLLLRTVPTALPELEFKSVLLQLNQHLLNAGNLSTTADVALTALKNSFDYLARLVNAEQTHLSRLQAEQLLQQAEGELTSEQWQRCQQVCAFSAFEWEA